MIALSDIQKIWGIYTESENYRTAVEVFHSKVDYEIIIKYNPQYAKIINQGKFEDITDSIFCYGVSDLDEPTSIEEAEAIFESLIDFGIYEEGVPVVSYQNHKLMLDLIVPISIALHHFSPNYFFPYLFFLRFFDIKRFADAFSLNLPEIPKKSNYRERCKYYWELCKIFYRFRCDNNLSPIDLWVFLYDFTPMILPKINSIIPKPTQCWFIGGRVRENETYSNFTFWQADKETKKGDILIFYETSPVSSITSMWIAQTDGIVDPFFHYYSNTYIGDKINLPHIHLRELKANERLSQHPLVRKSFQGVNGWLISGDFFEEIKKILSSKGFCCDKLPKLNSLEIPPTLTIKSERDVETKLLEPMLTSLGLKEGKDYIRQLGVHAGRGHRVFLDYAIHFIDEPDYETAEIIIEAKFYLRSNAEQEKAFIQARSYADLLHSRTLILCDMYRLFIYHRKDGIFDRNSYEQIRWVELKSPTTLNHIRKILH